MTYPDGFADGVAWAASLVRARLEAAKAEPLTRPSHRAGRITALGQLLGELDEAVLAESPRLEESMQ